MMQIISIIRSIIEPDRPGQGITDLLRSGFDSAMLEFAAVCMPGELENVGKPYLKRTRYSAAAEEPKQLAGLMKALTEQGEAAGLTFPIAEAPYAAVDTRRNDLTDRLTELALECIKICGAQGCGCLIVRSPKAAVSPTAEEGESGLLWDVYRDFYLTLAQTARENHVTILLENQCREIGGHLVRGFCADEQEAAARVDELNRSASERYGPWSGREEQEADSPGPRMTGQQDNYFGFCMNVGTCNLCGQNMYDFATALGDRIKAVVLRSCDGSSDASLLPFTCVKKGQPQTDWLNLIRGLRKIRFDGCLIMDYADTAAACPPILKPQLLDLAKAQGGYFAWQIGMERMLERYSSRVLFGAGNMCRNYMKDYGEAYPPLFTCDNNKALWDTDFCGLTVRSPEALKSLPSDCAIFICNIYYREIEAQLKDMGLPNPIVYFNDEYMPTFYVDRLDSVTRKYDGQV